MMKLVENPMTLCELEKISKRVKEKITHEPTDSRNVTTVIERGREISSKLLELSARAQESW